jgi:DNA-binding Lrp family transcriptional regulator
LDKLDFMIFKAVGFRPNGQTSGDLSRLNPWVIAKKVGADGNTVKVRLSKMKSSGFIQYFQIYPNFRLLGVSGTAYLFSIGDVLQKDRIIESCSLVDGVMEIHNFIGPQFCIDFSHQDSRDERRRLELFRSLTSCSSPERFYEWEMPLVEIGLSNLDWRIIKALRYDALRPLSSVAEDLAVTAKTVRRRFERMAQNNAVMIVPVVNPADMPDTITHTLLLYPSPGRHREVLHRAMEEFKDSCFLSYTQSPGNAMLCLATQTLAGTEDDLIRARKIEGMRDVKLLILKQMREYTQWMDSAIDRKITETGRQTESDSAPHPSPVIRRLSST